MKYLQPNLEGNVIRGIVDIHKPCEPASYTAAFLHFLEKEKGLNIEEVLQGTKLESSVLTDPEGFVTPLQSNIIITNALRLSGEPDLGFQFGQRMKISSHGFLGFAAMSAPNLQDAIQLMLKYFKTRTHALEVYFYIEQDQAVIKIEEAVLLEDLLPFIIETMFSSLYPTTNSVLGDIDESQVEVRLSYPKPEYAEKYQSNLPIKLSYDRSCNEIRFPVSLLQQSLVFSDPTNSKLAESECEKQLELTEDYESILAKVRRLLTQNPGHFPNLEKVAEECNTSPRTLKRRLKMINTSYQEILDNARKRIAVDHLANTSKTVDEIAGLLGYNDPSNFGRAFKKWKGISPSGYRELVSVS